MGGEGGEESRLFGRVLAQDDGFLALVDHEHRHRTRVGNAVSASIGRAPGVMTTTRRPLRCSAAATPARTSDDLPQPEGPTTASTPTAASRRRHTSTSASRPKKPSVSSTSYGTRPKYGQTAPGSGSASGDERRVLTQDRLLQRDQVGAGVDAQLGDQHRPRPVQRAQRVTLAARLILGQGEQRPPALAQRRLGHPGLRLGQHLPVLPGAQCSVEADLLGVQTQLVETAGLDPTRIPVLELAQRRPSPQRQRLTTHVGGSLVLPEREQLRAAAHHPLEAMRIDLVGGHRQAVAGR